MSDISHGKGEKAGNRGKSSAGGMIGALVIGVLGLAVGIFGVAIEVLLRSPVGLYLLLLSAACLVTSGLCAAKSGG